MDLMAFAGGLAEGAQASKTERDEREFQDEQARKKAQDESIAAHIKNRQDIEKEINKENRAKTDEYRKYFPTGLLPRKLNDSKLGPMSGGYQDQDTINKPFLTDYGLMAGQVEKAKELQRLGKKKSDFILERNIKLTHDYQAVFGREKPLVRIIARTGKQVFDYAAMSKKLTEHKIKQEKRQKSYDSQLIMTREVLKGLPDEVQRMFSSKELENPTLFFEAYKRLSPKIESLKNLIAEKKEIKEIVKDLTKKGLPLGVLLPAGFANMPEEKQRATLKKWATNFQTETYKATIKLEEGKLKAKKESGEDTKIEEYRLNLMQAYKNFIPESNTRKGMRDELNTFLSTSNPNNVEMIKELTKKMILLGFDTSKYYDENNTFDMAKATSDFKAQTESISREKLVKDLALKGVVIPNFENKTTQQILNIASKQMAKKEQLVDLMDLKIEAAQQKSEGNIAEIYEGDIISVPLFNKFQKKVAGYDPKKQPTLDQSLGLVNGYFNELNLIASQYQQEIKNPEFKKFFTKKVLTPALTNMVQTAQGFLGIGLKNTTNNTIEVLKNLNFTLSKIENVNKHLKPFLPEIERILIDTNEITPDGAEIPAGVHANASSNSEQIISDVKKVPNNLLKGEVVPNPTNLNKGLIEINTSDAYPLTRGGIEDPLKNERVSYTWKNVDPKTGGFKFLNNKPMSPQMQFIFKSARAKNRENDPLFHKGAKVANLLMRIASRGSQQDGIAVDEYVRLIKNDEDLKRRIPEPLVLLANFINGSTTNTVNMSVEATDKKAVGANFTSTSVINSELSKEEREASEKSQILIPIIGDTLNSAREMEMLYTLAGIVEDPEKLNLVGKGDTFLNFRDSEYKYGSLSTIVDNIVRDDPKLLNELQSTGSIALSSGASFVDRMITNLTTNIRGLTKVLKDKSVLFFNNLSQLNNTSDNKNIMRLRENSGERIDLDNDGVDFRSEEIQFKNEDGETITTTIKELNKKYNNKFSLKAQEDNYNNLVGQIEETTDPRKRIKLQLRAQLQFSKIMLAYQYASIAQGGVGGARTISDADFAQNFAALFQFEGDGLLGVLKKIQRDMKVKTQVHQITIDSSGSGNQKRILSNIRPVASKLIQEKLVGDIERQIVGTGANLLSRKQMEAAESGINVRPTRMFEINSEYDSAGSGTENRGQLFRIKNDSDKTFQRAFQVNQEPTAAAIAGRFLHNNYRDKFTAQGILQDPPEKLEDFIVEQIIPSELYAGLTYDLDSKFNVDRYGDPKFKGVVPRFRNIQELNNRWLTEENGNPNLYEKQRQAEIGAKDSNGTPITLTTQEELEFRILQQVAHNLIQQMFIGPMDNRAWDQKENGKLDLVARRHEINMGTTTTLSGPMSGEYFD